MLVWIKPHGSCVWRCGVSLCLFCRDKLKHCQVAGTSKHSTPRETNENIVPVSLGYWI